MTVRVVCVCVCGVGGERGCEQCGKVGMCVCVEGVGVVYGAWCGLVRMHHGSACPSACNTSVSCLPLPAPLSVASKHVLAAGDTTRWRVWSVCLAPSGPLVYKCRWCIGVR